MADIKSIELLAPARTADIGIAAIAHGADAVYIGPPAFGARQAAANSIADIRRLVEYAHPFRAKVYATLNTLLLPSELSRAERVATELYYAGVDALIVQDMALLRLDLPPVALHASTQCDIRSIEKAQFLQKVGFSQLVLARELSLTQIKEITHAVNIPIETFVHGALCVSYSGRCSASQICLGRSANRGECAQMCRLPYTLTDAGGKVLANNNHLLSLHDLNLSDTLPQLLQAGVSSFKIEGRLKDESYVKNIVSYYRACLDKIIDRYPLHYKRASVGVSHPNFTPNPYKSFNRGFTHFFTESAKPTNLTSPLTPKSLGEKVMASDLHAGDGIAFFEKGNYIGVRVNKVLNGKIKTYGSVTVPRGVQLYRTADKLHTEAIQRSTPRRTIAVNILLCNNTVTVSDQRGLSVSLPLPTPVAGEKNSKKLRAIFEKLGATNYVLHNFTDLLNTDVTYRPSAITLLRRNLMQLLDATARTTYPYTYRLPEDKKCIYPQKKLTFADNVANPLAESFYRDHGVQQIDLALEATDVDCRGYVAMTCRHCILRELNLCLQTKNGRNIRQPLQLISGDNRFVPHFNCKRCEMQLIYNP